MNKKIIIAISIVLVLAIAAIGYIFIRNSNQNYVVSINGENVGVAEFKFMLDNVKTAMQEKGISDFEKVIDGQKPIEVARERALESIVGYKLAVQQARKGNVNLTAEETAQSKDEVNYILEQNPQLNEILKRSGLSVKEFERINLEFSLANKFMHQLIDEYEITDQQAKDYYNQNIEKYVYEEDMVRAKHILIKTIDEAGNELPKEQQDKAKELAESILVKAKANEDFAKLAEEYSEDEGSKYNGGEYVFPRGQMVEEFENTAFTLEPGQISGLVKTRFGYHIIKVEEKYSKGQTQDFSLVVENIRMEMQYNEYNRLIESWKKASEIKKNDKLFNSIS